MKYLVGLVLNVCLLISCTSLLGQPEDGFEYKNKIYVDYIKTVTFNIASLPLTLPIVELSNTAPLVLRFDDLSPDVMDYGYRIIHCNSDWTPSSLFEMDYVEGYANGDLENYEFGYNTFKAFTHFELSIPNEDTQLTKSGNYLIVIYDYDSDEPVITQRFALTESKMQIVAQVRSSADVSKMRTHQEVDFDVFHKGIVIQRPNVEINASVIQNSNWNNELSKIKPVFISQGKMRFDLQDLVSFNGINEYRNLDLRSFRYRTPDMFEIQDVGDQIKVVLRLDKEREFEPYAFWNDLNGSFVIGNNEFSRNQSAYENANLDALSNDSQRDNQLQIDQQQRQLEIEQSRIAIERTQDDLNLNSDYASVLFTLETFRAYDNSNVYIVGQMNNWELSESNKMSYDESYSAYQGELFLKQGFYNYMYAIENKKTGKVTYLESEGSFFNTENNYTVLLYYRPFGERYDRLMAVQSVNSSIR